MLKKIMLTAVLALMFSFAQCFATPLPVYEGNMDSFVTAFNKTAAKTTGCFVLETEIEFIEEIGGTKIYSVKALPADNNANVMFSIDQNNQMKAVIVSTDNRADIDKAFRTVLITAGSSDAEINEVSPSYGSNVNTVGVVCTAKRRCFYVDTFMEQGNFVFTVTADSDFPVG